MPKIIWDDDELDEHIIKLLDKNATIENPLAPHTILRMLKDEYKDVTIGITRVTARLNELFNATKIKKTPGKHPKYYLQKRLNKGELK